MLSSIARTLAVYIVAVFAMRLMGKRQLGELQPSELVTTILISNVASICIEEPDLPLISSLIPIFLIASLEILNSTAAWYCPRYAQLLFGKPVTVVRDGQIDQGALRHLRITAADLAEALRGQQIFTPGDVAWGVVEPNGSISVAKKPQEGEAPPMLPLLIDQMVYTENLEAFSLDEAWLAQAAQAHGCRLQDVLILLHNGQDTLLIPKSDKKAAPKGGPKG